MNVTFIGRGSGEGVLPFHFLAPVVTIKKHPLHLNKQYNNKLQTDDWICYKQQQGSGLSSLFNTKFGEILPAVSEKSHKDSDKSNPVGTG